MNQTLRIGNDLLRRGGAGFERARREAAKPELPREAPEVYQLSAPDEQGGNSTGARWPVRGLRNRGGTAGNFP